ncbi:hypothetical protein J8C06_14945 [Chloracidobacterium validum]|uniref:Uncharacterized protein n=1 Tax=Chloracidobacterium validum TaxID=2821543 RepID=A0ABX8BBL0_9BACT|nr:hypothetical protein [Chloracidobacterium validum]QUW04328.1 hypothetical protein J8C06_14945 [Chloracidobacterium validum]
METTTVLRPFHPLTYRLFLICLGLLGLGVFEKVTFAGESSGEGRTARAAVRVSHGTDAKSTGVKPSAMSRMTAGRRFARCKTRRLSARWTGKRRVAQSNRSLAYRRAAAHPIKTAVAHPIKTKAVKTNVAVRSTSAVSSVSVGKGLPASVAVVEATTYQFAGYTATSDGATARMWYSRTYTVKSPYAYVGQMNIDGADVHVWMETTGTLLAGAVTESASEPLPSVAHLMERFPDGGLGVVIASPDDFAPPVEPAVEVVEFIEPSR